MSLKLGRGESVVSPLCFRIAEKRRKRKRPAARGAGPASKVLVRHPREGSHSNSRSRPSRWARPSIVQFSPGEEHMDIIALLKAERDKVARQLSGLNAALAAFAGTYKSGTSRPRRKMSAAARARISASQKARWAKARGQKVVSIAPKRHISAAGLARIRAAQRARARLKAGRK